MFRRNLLKELKSWREDPHRKPLVLRGARQTGKTTVVELFSTEFDQFVSLNLESAAARRFWEGDPSIDQILRNIEIAKNSKIIPGKTLLFLDEIQNEPRAIQSLRYFFEEKPDLHVIATGSLMELSLKSQGFSFPVGRVTFLYSYPLRFDEFLLALSQKELAEELKSIRSDAGISPALHSLAMDQFQQYLYVGGMPEAVQIYAEEKSYAPLASIKEGLLTSFEEDVPKYARPAQVPYLQFLIQHAPLFAGQRIQYTNFANSGYRSREMRNAFETLEKAMITQRILGSPQVTPPIQPNFRVSPKLLYLDTGLVSYALHLDPQSLKMADLNDLFRGTLAEQIVAQELLSQTAIKREPPSFWYRNQPGSTAEIDYCLQVKGKLIPIEVKSGKTGRLRSLFEFMDQSPHPYAVRIYSGPLKIERLITRRGKNFHLLSLPFYLTFNIQEILGDWIRE